MTCGVRATLFRMDAPFVPAPFVPAPADLIVGTDGAVDCAADEQISWLAAAGLLDNAEYLADLMSASRIAVEASVLALSAWGRVLWLVLRPMSRMAVAAWPSIRSGTATLAAAAAAQPKKAIAIEIALLVALVVLVKLVRFVRRRRYVSRVRDALRRRRDLIVAGVARRSRLLAAALPHLCYAFACVACSRVAERLGLRLRWIALLVAVEPVLSTGLPAMRTLLAKSGAPAEQRHALQYWVVWATAFMISGLFQAVPFASRVARAALPLLERFPMLHELPCCFWLWLQLPGGTGLSLAYGAMAPEFQGRSRAIAALVPSPPARVTGALQMLVAAAIGFERRSALAEAVHDGGVLLTGCVFLLTPTPIAAVGLLIIALGVPTTRTIDALGPHAADVAAVACAAQLNYWLSYAAMCGALRVLEPALRWVPFATHWQLLGVLWLQLPFFRTITRLLSYAVPPIFRQVTRAPATSGAASGDDSGARTRPNAYVRTRPQPSPPRR